MWLINGNELKQRLLAERDKIPYMLPGAVYEFGVPRRNHHGDSMRGGIRKALRCLEQCEHINAVPVDDECGHWEVDENYLYPIYKCSVCKEEFVTMDGTPADNLWNYCPNCGKKMVADEPKDDESEEDDDWERYCADKCYECSAYGDDYYTDENGELVSACSDCSYNSSNWEDDWDD